MKNHAKPSKQEQLFFSWLTAHVFKPLATGAQGKQFLKLLRESPEALKTHIEKELPSWSFEASLDKESGVPAAIQVNNAGTKIILYLEQLFAQDTLPLAA